MAGGLLVFMHAERIQESGDNYRAYNSGSGAAGAYQFTFGTWQSALRMAGLTGGPWYHESANNAPVSVQDAAASTLMSTYYFDFGRNWYNVAEAWYGGPGAVGHPDWGGGPGYPNVGQYAADVISIYNRLSGGDVVPGAGAGAGAGAGVGGLVGQIWDLGAFYSDYVTPQEQRLAAWANPTKPAFWQRPTRVA